MISADADVEVTDDNKLIRPQRRCQEGMQVFVELVPYLVMAGHRRGVDADCGGNFASLERQAEAHQTIFGALRQTGQSSHDVVPDGKDDARVLLLSLGATAPEEGVSGTYVLQLSMFGEPDLADCSDVDLVTRQSPSH
ncbi:hypothetical protein SprV_0200899500 [Sparganum proliferum]